MLPVYRRRYLIRTVLKVWNDPQETSHNNFRPLVCSTKFLNWHEIFISPNN